MTSAPVFLAFAAVCAGQSLSCGGDACARDSTRSRPQFAWRDSVQKVISSKNGSAVDIVVSRR